MPDELVPQDPGLLSSVLDTLRLPGFAVRNVFKGNLEGAGRNLLDLAGRTADALLPGDWTPDATRAEDRPEFKDLVDVGGEGAINTALNFAGDVITDPISYLPGSWVAKGLGTVGKGVQKGVGMLPEALSKPIVQGATKAKNVIQRTAGATPVSAGTEAALRAKQAASDLVGRAGSEGTVDALAGLSDRELNALGEVGHNMRLDPVTGKPVGLLDPSETLNFDQRLQKLFADDPSLSPERLLPAAQKMRERLSEQWQAAQEPASSPGGGVFFNEPMAGTPDVVMGSMKDIPSQGAKEYFPRQFSGIKSDNLDEILGLPKPIAERADWTSKDILEYLQKNPDVGLEFNAAKALAQRASTQGELAGRAQIGQSLFDMAKAGQVELPDELLQKFVAASRPAQAVVGSGSADISRLLGGDTTSRASDLLGLGERSGTSVVPATPEIAERSVNAPFVGEQSGTSFVPKTPELPEVSDPLSAYGISRPSGTSKPPAAAPLEDAGQASREMYGLGSPSGTSKPPTLADIAERATNAGLVGEQSGKSVVGASTGGKEVPLALRQLGAGEQTGKSVVGRSVVGEEIPEALRQLGVSQTGKSVVGKSTAPTITGLTDEERVRAKEYLLSKDFKLADPELRGAATAIAKQFPEEEATVLLNALNGLAPRGAFTGALAKLNKYFKGPAIFGAIVPKLGSITRNLTGGLFQQMANAEARGDVPRAAAQLIPNWLKSIDDGIEHLFGARIGQNEFAEVDKAFRASKGDPRKVLPMISDQTMKSAVKNGIFGNNFVNTEDLIRSAAQGGWRAFGKNLISYPATMFMGAERRMRYGLWKSLIQKGKSESEAARIVNSAFFDYGTHSVENRAIRDSLPFAQFAMKAIPQQAKFLAEKPLAASALANLSSGGNGPVYPGMAGKINIPIGKDEQGNQQYITSLGLPVESLSMLPNPSANLLDMGRQFEQNIVGASQPLLKTAYSVTSGRDPWFGSQYGSYEKLPLIGDAGAVGRTINQLTGTGLPGVTQGAGLLQMLGKTTDPKTSALESAASLLTGAKLQSVDESRALQQQLEEILKRNPSVSQYLTLSSRNGSDETQRLLEQLKQAKAAIKAKKKAALPVQ